MIQTMTSDYKKISKTDKNVRPPILHCLTLGTQKKVTQFSAGRSNRCTNELSRWENGHTPTKILLFMLLYFRVTMCKRLVNRRNPQSFLFGYCALVILHQSEIQRLRELNETYKVFMSYFSVVTIISSLEFTSVFQNLHASTKKWKMSILIFFSHHKVFSIFGPHKTFNTFNTSLLQTLKLLVFLHKTCNIQS